LVLGFGGFSDNKRLTVILSTISNEFVHRFILIIENHENILFHAQ